MIIMRGQDDSHDPGRDGSQSQLEKIRKPHETLFMEIKQIEELMCSNVSTLFRKQNDHFEY